MHKNLLMLIKELSEEVRDPYLEVAFFNDGSFKIEYELGTALVDRVIVTITASDGPENTLYQRVKEWVDWNKSL